MEVKQWVDIEHTLSPVHLSGLPWCDSHVPPEVTMHPTIGATWLICRKVFPMPNISTAPSPLGDPAFTNLIKESKFRASNYWEQEIWASFPQLQAMPCLSGLGFWRKMQLSHYLRSLPTATESQRNLMSFESDCTQTGSASHVISRMHSLLLKAHSDTPCKYWTGWERDLEMSIPQSDRESMVQHILMGTRCVRFQ